METMVLDLDAESAARLRKLAESWQVTEAEVVRRSLERAENDSPQKKDPVAMLRELHKNGGGLDPVAAEKYLAEVYEDRKNWRFNNLP